MGPDFVFEKKERGEECIRDHVKKKTSGYKSWQRRQQKNRGQGGEMQCGKTTEKQKSLIQRHPNHFGGPH